MCPYYLKVLVVSVWNGDGYCRTDLLVSLYCDETYSSLSLAVLCRLVLGKLVRLAE
jgi:hypothetical protein